MFTTFFKQMEDLLRGRSMRRLNRAEGGTISEGQDHVAVDDGGDAVRHGDHRAVLEVVADELLDDGVRGGVDRGRGFVQHQDAAVLQQRPPQAEQLPLSHAPVSALVRHCQGLKLDPQETNPNRWVLTSARSAIMAAS